MIHLTKHLVDL
jgi:hypothetical protein